MSESSSPAQVRSLADHFFRHESGRLVSVLTRIFGIGRLQLAEDVVQEAISRALHTWPYYGVPENPSGWITQTAKNLALDALRREKMAHSKEAEIAELTEKWAGIEQPDRIEHEIDDARLRLMFVCCHPTLPEDAQTSLALKTLCGFSNAEIASAFLTTEAAIAKRLTRARARLGDGDIADNLPSGEELTSRLQGVHKILYLLFNEGYKASSGEQLIREDLCGEAVRLAALVCRHPVGNSTGTHALLALMLLNLARFDARVDQEGQILRLQDQDRSRWNKALIGQGLVHLAASAKGGEVTWTHLQAAIAACHCTAPDYASTNWKRILELYDDLWSIDPSPVVALNRAVAVGHVHGAAEGKAAVDLIKNHSALDSYYLLYAVLAEFEIQLNDFSSASENLRKAIKLTQLDSEQDLLRRNLDRCVSRN